MTDSRSGGGGGDRREISEILSGLDPPRALPESLRQRLEDELSAGAPARRLEPELDERLAAALSSREDQDMAMLFSGLDGPRPLPDLLSARLQEQLGDQLAPRRSRIGVLARTGIRAQIAAGVAAVCLLVAAVTGIAIASHNSSRPAATKSSATPRRSPVGVGGGASASAGNGSAVATGGSSASGGVAPQSVNAASGTAGPVSPRTAAPAAGVTSGAAGLPSAASTPVPSTTLAPVLVPQVTSITPPSGSPTGGTRVTIRGLRFDGATAVHFGTIAALSFAVTSGGQIMAITPPHLPGFVNVTVTTAHGTSAVTTGDRYDYTP